MPVQVSGRLALERIIWFYPGLDSTPFNAMTPHGGVSVLPNTSNVLLASFQVPQTSWGILKVFGISAAVPAAFSNLTCTLRINGIPVPGYNNFCDQISDLIQLNYLFKKIESNDIIDIVSTNSQAVGGTAYVTFARLVGWYQAGVTIEDIEATESRIPGLMPETVPDSYILYRIE